MWCLYEAYEDLCKLRSPIDPRTFIPAGQDEHRESIVLGCIESTDLAHRCSAVLKGRNRRQPPPQLNLNLNLNVQLPPALQSGALPANVQQVLQQMLAQLQAQVQPLVQQIQSQMPIVGFEGWLEDAAWRPVPDWPSGP
jgi:hypothetical protein